MRIAVTGSSGFIGRNLVKVLTKLNYEVLEISTLKGLNIINWPSVKDLPNFDVIIHLAAKTFVPDSFRNPYEFYYVNQTSTLNALELARQRNAKVIFMSSYLYGPPRYIPVDEEHPLSPHNPYAQTKLISEQLCEGYNRDFGVPVTAFRLFNLYGPGQTGSFLIPEILQQISTGKVILKDPRPKRDYIHVCDVVNAIIKAVETHHALFNIFNLGSGTSYSVEELVGFFKKASQVDFEVEFTNEYRKGEVLDSVADITKIKMELRWEPMLDLQKGINSMFHSYL